MSKRIHGRNCSQLSEVILIVNPQLMLYPYCINCKELEGGMTSSPNRQGRKDPPRSTSAKKDA